MSVKDNYPTIRPSLLLDFANTKTLDPRITYSRASTATYYDDNTVAKAEENLLLRSQEFDNAAWAATTGIAAPTANSVAAPDGTTTADTITCLATTSAHRIGQGVTISAATQVVSVFAKAGTHNYVQISIGNQTAYANFDITSGSGVVGTNSGVISSSISDAGNGWYRCVMVYTNTAGNAVNVYFVSSSSAARNESWTAVGTESVYLWGAQLEQRSAVTAYTPTTTQPITNYIPVLQTAAAGVARFDHNPVTRESLGLLVEEQRTNLHLYSADLNQSGTSATRSTNYPTSTVAPDGSLTGNLLVEDTSASTTHYYYKSFSATSGTSYTISCYIKAKERSIGYIHFFTTSSVFAAGTAYFDLSNVTVVISGTITSSSITPVGNGWYRVSATQSAAATATGVYGIGLTNSTASTSYTGNGISGMYFWGAQLEAGAFPTSYIATSASQVTRAADSASMTGTNFSSWFNNAEGTVYLETRSSKGSFPTSYSFYSSDSNFIRLNKTSATSTEATNYELRVSSLASTVASFSPSGQLQKYSLAYQVDNFASCADGGSVSVDTLGSVPPNLTGLAIGQDPFNANRQINSYIRKLAYYPVRLSNTNLVALTQG